MRITIFWLVAIMICLHLISCGDTGHGCPQSFVMIDGACLCPEGTVEFGDRCISGGDQDSFWPNDGDDSSPCDTCTGETSYCNVDEVCIDDCEGRVCGDSPVMGYDCGECKESRYCAEDGSACIEACQEMDCGPSPYDGSDCGGCPNDSTCTLAGKCLADDLEWISLKKGSFWMGSQEACPAPSGYEGTCAAELGRHEDEDLYKVDISRRFELMRYELTQGAFTALMGWNPSRFTACGDNGPVEQVNWYDAIAFANQKSLAEALPSCYVLSNVECEDGSQAGSEYMDCFDAEEPKGGIISAQVSIAGGQSGLSACKGYRLPTEKEWEYAARSGSNSAYYPTEDSDGSNSQTQKQPLDSNLDLIGWYGGNAAVTYDEADDCSGWFEGADRCGTHPGGEKAQNAWGFYDMSGNVWEWTTDDFYYYPNDVSEFYDGCNDTSNCKLFRGGCWASVAQFCRSADRGMREPDHKTMWLGFRLARSLF